MKIHAQELDRLVENIKYAVKVELSKLAHNCPTCTHFDGRVEQCILAGKRPPAKIIAEGCNKFEYDIPF